MGTCQTLHSTQPTECCPRHQAVQLRDCKCLTYPGLCHADVQVQVDQYVLHQPLELTPYTPRCGHALLGRSRGRHGRLFCQHLCLGHFFSLGALSLHIGQGGGAHFGFRAHGRLSSSLRMCAAVVTNSTPSRNACAALLACWRFISSTWWPRVTTRARHQNLSSRSLSYF